jgi:hypothetical protein
LKKIEKTNLKNQKEYVRERATEKSSAAFFLCLSKALSA